MTNTENLAHADTIVDECPLGSLTSLQQVIVGSETLARHTELSRSGQLPVVVDCQCGWDGILEAFTQHQIIATYEAMRVEEDDSPTVESTLMVRTMEQVNEALARQ